MTMVGNEPNAEDQLTPVEEEAAAAEDLPVPVVLTFAEALQGSITQFSADVGALTALDAGVSQAISDKSTAEAALETATTVEGLKVEDRDAGRVTAVASRDKLVDVLRAWQP